MIKNIKNFFLIILLTFSFFGCGVYSSPKSQNPCLKNAPYPQVGILKQDYKKWQKNCYQKQKDIEIKNRSHFKLD